MKKIILHLFIITISCSNAYPQTIREAEFTKEKITKKLPLQLNRQFKISVSALNESFEDPAFPPAGWIDYTVGGSGWSRESAGTILPGWGSETISTPSGGGSYVAYCTYNGATSYNNQWLITPLIQNIQAGDRLYFCLRKQQSFADTIYIYYAVDGTNWTQIGHVGYPSGSDESWGLWYIRLGDHIPAGSDVFIAFQEFVSDNSSYGAAISLDLVYTVSYPADINIINNFTFGDPAKSEGYRMVSLPGITNRPANTGIPGEQRKDWNIFDDNGAETGTFLVEFNGTAAFNFLPGKGFWILSKNPFGVNQIVSSVPLTDGFFEIPLHSGWNIIGNPFEKTISWTNVQNINGVTDPINFFDGSYSQPPAMEPYKGYYYFNRDNRPSLFIPYNYTQSLGKQNGGNDLKNSLKISLLIDSREESNIKVSINNDSENGCDKFDIFAPPGNFETAKITIMNDLLPSYKYLMVDSRNKIGEGQSYNLNIKNSSGKPCVLLVKGIENFMSNEIYLLDLNSKKSHNLKMESKIEISTLHENNGFRLLIGSKEYVDKTRISALPSKYRLYQNYPNPFNPMTILSFDLPRNQNIKLIIYNILGERVKTLYNGYLEAGKYEFIWDGTNELNTAVSSGAYIYSLESPEIRVAKKMILNR